MNEYPVSSINKVKRVPSRGNYEEQVVHEILDAGCVAHVGFAKDQRPFVIPMIYGREERMVYLHGATSSRLMKELKTGIPVCMTVTHLDGLVLARSAFHHSMNYRSVVIFGTAFETREEDKLEALKVISENMLKGRWDSVRKPNAKELKATMVLQIRIDTASAKIRTGPPVDEKEDYKLPVWAGVVPVDQVLGNPVPDPKLSEGVADDTGGCSSWSVTKGTFYIKA